MQSNTLTGYIFSFLSWVQMITLISEAFIISAVFHDDRDIKWVILSFVGSTFLSSSISGSKSCDRLLFVYKPF